eukprot:5854022-Pleurochrysis_carterae.AAC.1
MGRLDHSRALIPACRPKTNRVVPQWLRRPSQRRRTGGKGNRGPMTFRCDAPVTRPCSVCRSSREQG